jgi:isoleucyl-tRNA synthetase
LFSLFLVFMFDKPSYKPSTKEMEQEILKMWKDKDILQQSIDSRPADKTKTVYDGPITANGIPHHGHMLTFVMKDVFPKYWTMQGYRVSRSLGWDCQGIPVEYEIEKQLGFQEKKDIETYGVAEFNKLCRESVETHKQRIIDLEERMGRLTNSEEEYQTMDKDYIESVWWSLKTLYDKKLLYEGFKVVPYSTRAGTVLSNAEVALGGYKPVTEEAVTVKFKIAKEDNVFILAWTTTPWTLPSNLALAVGKNIWYSKVMLKEGRDEVYIVASDLVEKVFAGQEYQEIEKVEGKRLIGLTYEPLFPFFAGHRNAFVVYDGFHVTTESGTGIVHLAPYGAEDSEIFAKEGIESFDILDEQGHFGAQVPDYRGIFYKKANKLIIEDLRQKELLWKVENHTHDMPFCWRTNTPLIYKPIVSWYVAMSQLRENLLKNNSEVGWIPEHIREGRFGKWLADIKDWGISRNRYWGTPLPIWQTKSGKVRVVGSYAELKELSGVEISDPHRPYIDDITFEIEGEIYTRVSDVLDVWYDSGAMPFARFHYPFENKDRFESKFPAEYIAEGIDQTRGWFYSLLALATALFDKTPYRNVIVNGMVLADDGTKLSKSKKNYEAPDEMLDEFGADAIRMNFLSTPIVQGEDTTVSAKTLKIQVQEWLLPYWNIYAFFATYANLHNWTDEIVKVESKDLDMMDRWMLVRSQTAVADIIGYLDEYKLMKATYALKEWMQDISKWYIKSSRGRFASGNIGAIQTLYGTLMELTKVLAPFMPFMSEYVYQKLTSGKKQVSVHLENFPSAVELSEEESQVLGLMNKVRDMVEIGFVLRDKREIKVRQALGRVLCSGKLEMADWMVEILKSELNVKAVEKVEWLVAGEQIEVLDLPAGGKLGMDFAMTPELEEDGKVRDLVRFLQATRKKMCLSMEQRIKVQAVSDTSIQDLVKKFEIEIFGPTGIVELRWVDSLEEVTNSFKVGGSEVSVKLEVL